MSGVSAQVSSHMHARWVSRRAWGKSVSLGKVDLLVPLHIGQQLDFPPHAQLAEYYRGSQRHTYCAWVSMRCGGTTTTTSTTTTTVCWHTWVNQQTM